VDAKLGIRQQELHRVEQELNKLSEELEETSERKQQLQFAKPDVQNAVVKTVNTVSTFFNVINLSCYEALSGFPQVLKSFENEIKNDGPEKDQWAVFRTNGQFQHFPGL